MPRAYDLNSAAIDFAVSRASSISSGLKEIAPTTA
jgi:hypothetical protein